ncbi:MAG: hypothetical protein ABIN89_15145 [Chitinophagaceae bacterium]
MLLFRQGSNLEKILPDEFKMLSEIIKDALNNLGSATLKDIILYGLKATGASRRYENSWVAYTLPKYIK